MVDMPSNQIIPSDDNFMSVYTLSILTHHIIICNQILVYYYTKN